MKKILKVFLFAAFWLTFVTPAFAGISPQLLQAVDLIYNAHFPQAQVKIDAYIKAHPQDAAGYLMRGMNKEWDQAVNNRRKTLDGAIMADYQKANELALKAWEADHKNPDRVIMLGNTYMYIAKKQVDAGNKMKGGFTLKKSKELMVDAIAKNPSAYDAYFALGIFNYFSQNVPAGFRWLAALIGFNGNAAKGLDYIRKAADNRNLTQGDAAFMLTWIFDQKKNYPQALQYNRLLLNRFPNNPIFQYQNGEFHTRNKDYAHARKSFDDFYIFCASKPKGFCSQKWLFLTEYFLTHSYVIEKNYPEAKKHLAKAIALNDGQFKNRNPRLDYWQGLIAKSEGKKEEARAAFKKVEARKGDSAEVWRLTQEAMQGL